MQLASQLRLLRGLALAKDQFFWGIRGCCFEHCPLSTTFIPKLSCEIEGSAFIGSRLKHILVDAENEILEVSARLLVDKRRRKVIRSEPLKGNIVVPKGIEVLGPSSFSTAALGNLMSE
jgi:hypothetical protein